MDPQLWSQATGRIGSLEDLLRRNEGSLASALGRVKDIETALNTMHRALGRIGPDLAGAIDELRGTKRKVDLVDATCQSKLREVESGLMQELRNQKPIPLPSDPVFQRLSSEFSQVQGELQETISQTRRLTDAAAADSKAIRALEQDSRWIAEQTRDQIATQREFSSGVTRRMDGLAADVRRTQEEIQTVDSGLRKIIDAAVKAAREEVIVRLEQESKARMALQADFITAFGRMREDVIKGFTETAANLKNLDETAHSLETVLRAEVRSRMSGQEELGKRVDSVEDRLKREAISAAEYLKALDTQMSAALRDVRDVSASECRSQLDTVWRSVDELSDQVKKIGGRGAAQSATNDELQTTRMKMFVDNAVHESREDIMKVVESRFRTVTAEIDGCSLKSETQELRTRFELKIQELERLAAQGGRRGSITFDAATAGAPEHASSTATAMKMKKITERMDDAEKQLLVVAEAVRDVHEELVDKLERLDAQSASLAALQTSLRETFDRDQRAVQEQTSQLRVQLVDVMEEVAKIRPRGADDDEETKGVDKPPAKDEAKPSEAPADGEEEAVTPAADKADAAGSPAPPATPPPTHNKTPPASPSVRFSHRALEAQQASLRRDVDALQHELRRDLAESKAQQAQLFDRHVALQKLHREDVGSLKSDLAAISDRAQQNAEQLSDRLHEVTETTNDNFAKLNEDLASVRSQSASALPTGAAKASAAASTPRDSDIARRLDAQDKKIVAVEQAVRAVSEQELPRLEKRIDELAAAQPAADRDASRPAAAPPAPRTPPPPTPTRAEEESDSPTTKKEPDVLPSGEAAATIDEGQPAREESPSTGPAKTTGAAEKPSSTPPPQPPTDGATPAKDGSVSPPPPPADHRSEAHV